MDILKLDISVDEKLVMLRVQSLTRLHIFNREIEEDNAKVIATALLEPSVTKFNITNCEISNESMSIIADSLSRASLIEFILRRSSVETHDAEIIVHALTPSLTHFCMCQCQIKLANMNIIANGLSTASLTKLNLSDINIETEGIITLIGAINPSLTKLNLSLNNLSYNPNASMHSIARALSSSSLLCLNLSGSTVEECDVEILAEALQTSRLNKLYLSDVQTKGDCSWIKYIVQALPQSSLMLLDLSDNAMERCEAKMLSRALPTSHLRKPFLSSIQSKDDNSWIKYVSKALPKSSLILLDLSENNIGCEEAKMIAKILNSSTLTTLKLNNNRIKEEGCVAIADALVESLLTKIDIVGNQIGNEGAIALVITTTLAGSHLKSLNIGHNGIGKKGTSAIINILTQSSLTALDLYNSKMRKETIAKLISILGDTLLIRFDSYTDALTDEEVTTIRKKLSKNKIRAQKCRFNKMKVAVG